MDNYNEKPLLLTGGLTADELPEGRAVYDTNDKFKPTGRDLLSPLSWLPGPIGGISGGADAYYSAREGGLNPLAAAAIGTGVGALGTFGILGPMSKFLPKGKRGAYLKLGPRTMDGKNTILSDTGEKFEFNKDVDTKAIIEDANAWQKAAEEKPSTWELMWYGDMIDDPVSDANKIPDEFIKGMDEVDIDAYSGALPEIPKDTVYHHFSNTLFNKPEKGHLGLRAGDNLDIGPTGGLYLTDDSTVLNGFGHGYDVLGPSKNNFIFDNDIIDDYPVLLDYINKKGLNELFFRGLEINRLVNSDYPYINRFLRKNGYAGKTDMHNIWSRRTSSPFQEYATFDPNDTVILNRIKNYNNPGVLR